MLLIYNDRNFLWADITSFSKLFDNPWIILGDFNTVLASHEKVGGKNVHPRATANVIESFQEANLCDLKLKGCRFTWSNRSGGVRGITSKLDRVLVNPAHAWLAQFTDSEAEFLPAGISDHSPMVVTIFKNDPSGTFKFYNFWADEPDFMDIVRRVWSTEIRGNPM